ncbi:hypothetical protein ACHAXN_004682 [Cyclotella atomus]
MPKTAPPQSLEQSTLHSMLHDRDAQISSLLHQLHSISDNISSLQKELHHKAQARKHQREDHSSAIKTLKEEHAQQRAHLARYESKIKSGGGLRVHEYAALMKAANKDVESSYVIRLQAQLCRAMHSLGVMESQLALVKENCSSLIKSMKEDLSHMVDDRTRREVELMNTLAMVDAEKRSWQAEMEKKLREQEDLLDSVRDEYEELGLEYDEEEVRRALELQMLTEQVERVKKEKSLAEKDLLAVLLEREEQIMKVKLEVEGLECALKELKGESDVGTNDGGVKVDETVSVVGADDTNDKVKEVAVETGESTPTVQSDEQDNSPDVPEAAAAEDTTTVEEQIKSATETPAETEVVQTADESNEQNTADVVVDEPTENPANQDQSDDQEKTSENTKEGEKDVSEPATELEDTTIEEHYKPDVTGASGDKSDGIDESSSNAEGADAIQTPHDNESDPAELTNDEATKETDIVDHTNTVEQADSAAQETIDEVDSALENQPAEVEVKDMTESSTATTKEEHLDGSRDETDNNNTVESKESDQ